ncbi:uncharacterized protein J4E88_010935 [Alternaria novae-zelandiae]|uniref:uncharacterized protein n=1 Tax=Alternaria triticimaculans TaxID=297637 RepID=UPI0020C28145|nr:uncharacterized protein J4E78_003651 [Alternaria triticimaculans]XP_049249732.1 uncharacterized protein J4E88_010935 [Alternaria novae-zelandiae]XP_051321034.1 uncharacterized protein J4E85_010967 [Alternaria conjuncta]KAI4662145.1 hypothetical protein J4E88_010935 [Alternaria novae-zelandiae]KAI4663240.1 hypothetical protein J4E78_003651 [Alternaria triticimaculans]KAI4912992.1 hypothetical protein J4E85_010967 [Alternaria conjuncta]
MAVLESTAVARDAKPAQLASSPLARVMREFEELVQGFETGLLRSLEDPAADDVTTPKSTARRDEIRREACRLAISDLSNQYTPKYIRRSLDAAELEGKRVEDQLQSLSLSGRAADDESDLGSLHNGYFRLYSTELFDLLGQPTELRFGTLRFHKDTLSLPETPSPPHVTVELALNDAFFVADSEETLPYHTFRLPTTPSLQNRGIRSRKYDDDGTFPEYDSWLLFTFLGNGCIKLEVPIEMCADVYGGCLRGRENEEVLFWGFFVDDDE